MSLKHGTLECVVLNVLWGFESNNNYTNSVKDVYDKLSLIDESKRAYTTIKTVMDRLSEKGILLRFKQRNKFYYRTAFSKKDMLTRDIERLANLYFEGNLDALAIAIETLTNENKFKNAQENALVDAI